MELSSGVLRERARWTGAVFAQKREPSPNSGVCTIGILPGEGIGPEVIGAALGLLPAIERARGVRFELRFGSEIGRDAERLTGRPLPDAVARFCESVFADGGAILAGPGGGRFVYELRRRFDLFCKISPVFVSEVFAHAGRLKAAAVRGTDILVVRENAGGMYFGEARESTLAGEGRVCEHTFRYSEREIRRIVEVGAALAVRRRRTLTVVVKDGGLPALTALWRETAEDVAARAGLRVAFVNIDLVAYQLIQYPSMFDVVVADNLFGDVLADVAAVLLGSRGLSYSGNFSAQGAAVYQTNHGGATDIAGEDRANPIGQIHSLAMMLRESFGLWQEAAWIEQGVEEVLCLGFRTFDMAEEGTALVGTRELGERIASAVERIARSSRR
ncbi:MAG: isocitrate/isopropylmalate family dehydrogenase [Thermoanaerobaculia bacterium]